MSPPNNDQTIEPAAAPLSKHRAHVPRRRRRGTLARRLITSTVLLVVLASSALSIFLYLSNRIDPIQAAVAPNSPPEGRKTATETPPFEGSPMAPFESLQREKARDGAKRQLGRFVELELRLEQEMNSGAWAAEELAAIQDRANQADQWFIATDYDDALAEYAAAVADFESLLEHGTELVTASVEAGTRALDARDAPTATAAFERALTIMPNHSPAQNGLARAERLPEIIERLREFDRAELREDYEAAGRHLARIRAIDPLTKGLADRTARIKDALREIEYRDHLSQGFTALEASDFETASAAFEAVLAERPSDAAALSGRQQTERARTLAKIDHLRAVAREREHEERWQEALAAYDEVLTIDPSIKFARDGRARTYRQSSMVQSMETVLGDPAGLSSDAHLAKAREVLAAAQAEADVGDAFHARREQLQRLLTEYATPIPMVLVSDAETEVTIVRIGVLGTFERRQVMLRPGRYIITGSRDGCRDVRKEVILGPETAPVDIRCQERI